MAFIQYSSTGKLAVWRRDWIPLGSVAAATPPDRGSASGRLDAIAVDFPLHHGAPMTVASVELGDLFIVLRLGYLTVIECN